MAYPDFNKPYILCTDASEQGLGAVLYQRQNGETRVIAYASRSLTPAEKKLPPSLCEIGISCAKMVNM